MATRREKEILDWFEKNIVTPKSELLFDNPFELLVAVMLSAQCTDKRVNMVTPSLLERYPTPKEMAKATYNDIYQYISSISYPNNKARHLVEMAKMLVEDFQGVVPQNVDELMQLPGIGRKSANVRANLWHT